MRKKQVLGFVILVGLVGAFVGYVVLHNKNAQTAVNKLQVTASFYPLYDFSKNVAGSQVDVTNVTPAGSEPHDYEPSPQTLVEAQRSAVFVYNGGTMEPWIDKFLTDYQHIAVKGSDNINLLTSDEGRDPHYWLDPVYAQQTVNNIRDGLIKADPAHRDAYTRNAASYNAGLAKLDLEFKNGLHICQSRTIVASHAAFGYLAKRYNIDIVSIAGLTPDQEPSPAKLAEVSKIVKEKDIKYIFFESLVSPRLAATIAQETGAKTAVFEPIEGLSNEAQKQGKNYLSVQRDNLAALRTALACQ